MPSSMVASCSANCRPMQARSPVPKGLKACGERAASGSASNREGSNSSGLSPQTGSRCSIGVDTKTVSPARSGIRPPSRVSCRASRLKAGAVGQSRIASLRTCRVYRSRPTSSYEGSGSAWSPQSASTSRCTCRSTAGCLTR